MITIENQWICHVYVISLKSDEIVRTMYAHFQFLITMSCCFFCCSILSFFIARALRALKVSINLDVPSILVYVCIRIEDKSQFSTVAAHFPCLSDISDQTRLRS